MDNNNNDNNMSSNSGDMQKESAGGRKPSLAGVKSKFTYFSGLMEKNAGKVMKKQEWISHGEKVMAENKSSGTAGAPGSEGVQTATDAVKHDVSSSMSQGNIDASETTEVAKSATSDMMGSLNDSSNN